MSPRPFAGAATEAGGKTRRSGIHKIKQALREPQLLGIIAGTIVLVAIGIVATALAENAIGFHTSHTYLAFVLGFGVATALLLLLGTTMVFAGGVNWVLGGQAERWTGELLRGLGPEWRIMHNLEFTTGQGADTWQVDVDNVAVGPGGVLVVETKYSTDLIDLDAERLSFTVRNAAEQANRNAGRVRKLFVGMPESPHVIPVVIFWGFRVTTPKTATRMLGRNTHVVMGADADRWLPTLTNSCIDPRVTQEAWKRVELHSIPEAGTSKGA
jgi:hypothetical protein